MLTRFLQDHAKKSARVWIVALPFFWYTSSLWEGFLGQHLPFWVLLAIPAVCFMLAELLAFFEKKGTLTVRKPSV